MASKCSLWMFSMGICVECAYGFILPSNRWNLWVFGEFNMGWICTAEKHTKIFHFLLFILTICFSFLFISMIFSLFWIDHHSLICDRSSRGVFSQCDKAEILKWFMFSSCLPLSHDITVFGSWPKLNVKKEGRKRKEKNFSQRRTGRREPQGETNQGGSRDRCSPQGEPPLTRLPHKLFCSFRLHSKVVELGYKIISQATCLSSLAVQLANWREWFPVWATIQNMAVKIGMI